MNLIIGLAAVDRVNDERQMRQLADGWMGRESATARRLRVLGVRALLALATRLTPADQRATIVGHGTTPTAAV
jgi:hypothetical protein